MDRAELIIKNLLKYAGIKINGRNPWDIQVQDNRFYNRIITDGSLGLGESYMDGWWDAARLKEMIARILSAHLDRKVRKNPRLILFLLQRKVMNIASKKRAFKVGEQHYDLGNELYEAMLDPDLNYSCGYWKDLPAGRQDAKNLEEAQIAKIDLICRKLQLRKGMKVLDIGSGWGNFAKYAAKKYGVSVVGITVSKEQAALATKRCKGLPVEFKIMDYRDLKETGFDRVVSIGMFEHVTYKNYDTFMKIAERSLKPGGLFLLHTIGSNESIIAGEPWQEKYIFPNSHLPSIAQIGKAAENKFVIEDIHNFGHYYYPTLMSWWKNFDANWPKLKKINPEKYDDRFYKMWKYYLLSCAGAFKSRTVQLYQVVLSKEPYPQIYQSVR